MLHWLRVEGGQLPQRACNHMCWRLLRYVWGVATLEAAALCAVAVGCDLSLIIGGGSPFVLELLQRRPYLLCLHLLCLHLLCLYSLWRAGTPQRRREECQFAPCWWPLHRVTLRAAHAREECKAL